MLTNNTRPSNHAKRFLKSMVLKARAKLWIATQPLARAADNTSMSRITFETGAILVRDPLLAELWLLALSHFSPRHGKHLWDGFDDNIGRLLRSCAIRAKA